MPNASKAYLTMEFTVIYLLMSMTITWLNANITNVCLPMSANVLDTIVSRIVRSFATLSINT